jgi:protein tyrosine phosphatase (PTP) superfamily phosphohydrolase (DUF442 family)
MMKTIAKIIGAILLIACLILAVPVLWYFPGHNFRTVEKGAFYGSRQMSGKAFDSTIKKYGIKTVINLRGGNPGSTWYDEEIAACKNNNAAHFDLGWSKNSIPNPESLAKFIAIIETEGKPFLAHCEGGTHRTGTAAAIYLLLKGESVTTARKQFGPFFRDAPIGKLVALYEGSSMPFKQWALEAYPAIYASLKAENDKSAPAAPQPLATPQPAPAK